MCMASYTVRYTNSGLFEKTPSKRWGVEEVLQNKWVKFQYFRSRHLPHILAYREDSNNQPDAMKEVGCETTMIPYLQKMFKADIEKILTTQGSLSDRCPHLEADNDSLNSPKSKKKIMGWISKVLHQ